MLRFYQKPGRKEHFAENYFDMSKNRKAALSDGLFSNSLLCNLLAFSERRESNPRHELGKASRPVQGLPGACSWLFSTQHSFRCLSRTTSSFAQRLVRSTQRVRKIGLRFGTRVSIGKIGRWPRPYAFPESQEQGLNAFGILRSLVRGLQRGRDPIQGDELKVQAGLPGKV